MAHPGPAFSTVLSALAEASRLLAQTTDAVAVFELIVQQAARLLHAEGASVILVDANVNELVFQAASGPVGGELVGVRMPIDRGIAGQVVRTGRAVRIDDVASNRHFYDGIDARTRHETHALLAAPMQAGERVVGVIEVVNPAPGGTFTDQDLTLLNVFANLAAVASQGVRHLERARRFSEATRPAAAMIGLSPAIARVQELVAKLARSDATVLITGPTGTGKELAARAIHDASARRHRPYVPVNCAALPQSLLESELFGHEQGAFTGATHRRAGRFELADGGTLFLDEIGEMDSSAQAKLLRVLQEKRFMRVGGREEVTCDIRIIAATNRNLRDEVDAGRFREDLYYRLNVLPLVMPPLAQRREDIPALAAHFLHTLAHDVKVHPPLLTPHALAALQAHPWPGNVRELRNVIERCVLLCSGEITPADLLLEPPSPSPAPSPDGGQLAEQERTLIQQALLTCAGNQSQAARQLGITRDKLRSRMKKHGL